MTQDAKKKKKELSFDFCYHTQNFPDVNVGFMKAFVILKC